MSEKKSNNTNSFMDENSNQIINLHNAGSKPKEIAAALCSSKSLKSGSITGKQISSWINYRKSSGQLKTRPVSLSNNNLRAEFGTTGTKMHAIMPDQEKIKPHFIQSKMMKNVIRFLIRNRNLNLQASMEGF